MAGMTPLAASVWLLACAGAAAGQAVYLPLDLDNQWIYRCTGACGADPTLTAEITRSGTFNGIPYSLLHGWGDQDYWLRMDDAGRVLAYDPATGKEQLWYDFPAPEGQTYQEALPFCCGQATIASRAANYSGPVGSFPYALEIHYPGVFQVGVFQEQFLPWVGLVHRSQARGGPAVAYYDLIYARLGGVTVISQPEVAFGLSLSRNEDLLIARISLRNTLASPLSLNFPTGQMYDLEVRDENGTVVYRWSDGKAFIQVFATLPVAGEKNWTISVPVGKLPAGRYTAEAWLTTAGARRYAAIAGFDTR